MKKTAVSSNSLGAFLSPGPGGGGGGGAPNYAEKGEIYYKGWSSERVPHPSTTGFNGRRHISSASALATPFYSGRALPSKWEDAERWICSPVASYPSGFCNNSCVSSHSHFVVDHRRPKSKSGPIVPPALPHPPPSSSSAIWCYHYSPTAMNAVEAPHKGLMVVGSPFSTGVLEADRVFRGSVSGGCDGWMDLVSESSSSSSKEEKPEDTKEVDTSLSPVVSRRDMATQMSPDATSPNQSPPREREASPVYPSPQVVVSGVEPQSGSLCRQEVREVKIDRRARMIKRPKRRVSKVSRREPPEVEDVYTNSGASASSWEISEPAMSHSKLQREEAKIAAWENLQKAKAEAAIRKLEVKLEKKKSESVNKILNKLQTAKHKAQEMRSSLSNKEGNQTSKNSLKITHLVRRHTFMNPFMSCFAPRVDCRTSSTL